MDPLVVPVAVVVAILTVPAIWFGYTVLDRLDRIERKQQSDWAIIAELRKLVLGRGEEKGLVETQAELMSLVDMLIDCQDQTEDELYGDGEGKEGLVQSFESLWNKVYFLEGKEEEKRERVQKAGEAMKFAGWAVADDPADLFMSALRLPSDEPKREERCIAGQCNPSDCDREQCPHRTAEFAVTPFKGVLDGFNAEWEQVLSQGQVELPCCERTGQGVCDQRTKSDNPTPN